MARTDRTLARNVKCDIVSLWFAARDLRVRLSVKIVAGAVPAFALSPIDLIPDFIPVLGYLDDLVIVPQGIILAVSLVPAPLMAEFRNRTEEAERRPRCKAGMIFIVAAWLAAAALLIWALWPAAVGAAVARATAADQSPIGAYLWYPDPAGPQSDQDCRDLVARVKPTTEKAEMSLWGTIPQNDPAAGTFYLLLSKPRMEPTYAAEGDYDFGNVELGETRTARHPSSSFRMTIRT